ncbi:DUF1566 domain-containing protein [Desulfococcaceae bacterium HSG9]|nr:DUF1566 domain-containing protein [Desulfococcaceae bacterium HSG9]
MTLSPDDVKKVYKLKQHPINHGWGPTKWIRNDFKVRGDVVIDRTTKLMWQRKHSDKGFLNQDIALYFEKINRGWFAGYGDWRLPTLPELMSLWEVEKQSNGLCINQIFEGGELIFFTADSRSRDVGWCVLFQCPGTVGSQGYNQVRLKIRAVRTINDE